MHIVTVAIVLPFLLYMYFSFAFNFLLNDILNNTCLIKVTTATIIIEIITKYIFSLFIVVIFSKISQNFFIIMLSPFLKLLYLSMNYIITLNILFI